MGDLNWGVGGRQFRRKWTRDKYKISRMFEKAIGNHIVLIRILI